MMSKQPGPSILRLPPPALAAGGLVLAALLFGLPPRAVAPLRGQLAAVLRPGQVAVSEGRALAGGHYRRWQRALSMARDMEEAEAVLARVEHRGRQQEARALAQAAWHTYDDEDSTMQVSPTGATMTKPLIALDAVGARLLGDADRRFLTERRILSLGSRAGVEPSTLVTEWPAAVVDVGRDAQVAQGHLVLDGARVWGRVEAVGPLTSIVQRVTDSGYRDVVHLASGTGPALKWGPRGVLQGSGEGECRIRFIEAIEPVEVGDRVYAAGDALMREYPMLYGEVSRAQRVAGSSHWAIWMTPATAGEAPYRVAVVRRAINPQRTGEALAGAAGR